LLGQLVAGVKEQATLLIIALQVQLILEAVEAVALMELAQVVLVVLV
jgi:hypothetical protein